jgi:hypothetical protein
MKNKLLDIINNPNDKLICVDLDWTLCEWEFWWEWEPKPLTERIEFIRNLYIKWAHIIIYTARRPVYYKETISWLIKYDVPFHWVSMFIKPWADCYLDDKSLNDEDVFLK